MNQFSNNVRDLWSDSVWFRVSTAIMCIGVLMFARAISSKAMTRSRDSATASQAVNQIQGLLNDDGLNLTADQQAMVQDGVNSLTPEQHKKYQQVLDQLQRVTTR